MSVAKLGSEQCLPLRGKQPHERVCVANWRRSLCAAKRPRTPAGVNGCSVGAAYMPPAAYRGNPSTGKGAGCRPPLPLSSATHLWQSVGAGHARPAALPCHPFAFCIVGRGLARLPVTPADGQESLRLACARHLHLTREAFLASSARAKRLPSQGSWPSLRGLKGPDGLCVTTRQRSPVVTPLNPSGLLRGHLP